MVRAALITLAVGAILLHTSDGQAATRYDPRLAFRTIRTEHFDVHYHQGEALLAQRLASIAERMRARFEHEMGLPRGRVQVILVNQEDLANGWATPFPYDAIEIAALAPEPQSLIGNTTDWLELVFSHEFAHIVHLDRTRGFMRVVRGAFGRTPVAFPNVFLPVWQVEGLATYEESRMTGQGRVPAPDFRAIVDVAAREGRFEPQDRASGGLVDWPSGHAPYAYGAYFHDYLSQRYGAERIAQLADVTSGRVPFFGAGAFRRVYGKSIETLWSEFRASRDRAPAPVSATDRAATRLTRNGFQADALAIAPDGTAYYRVSDARRFPSLMALRPGTVPRRVTWRFEGNATAVSGDWLVFDQVHFVESVALQSDLYAVRRDGGRLRRLTRNARAADPDVSSDGRTIVCTVERAAQRAIAMLPFAPNGPVGVPRLLASDGDYASPRWSPDGRSIAAVRRRDGRFELVLIDAASGAARALLSHESARFMTPAWSYDGNGVLFTMEDHGRALNVFSVSTTDGSVRRVTDSASGARQPRLAPDGRSLFYIGYTADGDDVFSVATDPATWPLVDFRRKAEATDRKARDLRLETETVDRNAGDLRLETETVDRKARDLRLETAVDRDLRPETESVDREAGGFRLQAEESDTHAYSPWRTLRPTYWTPLVASDAGEMIVGGATAMADVLGRHAYAADAAWSADRARPDWHVSYAYDRLRPTLFALYSDDTDPVRGGDFRTRELQVGALLAFRQVRYSNTFIASFDAERDSLVCPAACQARVTSPDRRSARGGWLFDSRRAFGYSISTEEGAQLEAAVEASRISSTSDVPTGAAIVDGRAFQRVAGHTVVALRAAAALAWGDAGARRVFSASGPGPSVASFDFGRDTIGLLRGFDADEVVASRAAVLNADLRFPIARPQRGAGSWPVFMQALHGAAFVDAGHAWDAAPKLRDVRLAIGGEFSVDAVLGHYLPLTFTAGAAWTRDPSSPDRTRGAIFARVGRAF